MPSHRPRVVECARQRPVRHYPPPTSMVAGVPPRGARHPRLACRRTTQWVGGRPLAGGPWQRPRAARPRRPMRGFTWPVSPPNPPPPVHRIRWRFLLRVGHSEAACAPLPPPHPFPARKPRPGERGIRQRPRYRLAVCVQKRATAGGGGKAVSVVRWRGGGHTGGGPHAGAVWREQKEREAPSRWDRRWARAVGGHARAPTITTTTTTTRAYHQP